MDMSFYGNKGKKDIICKYFLLFLKKCKIIIGSLDNFKCDF